MRQAQEGHYYTRKVAYCKHKFYFPLPYESNRTQRDTSAKIYRVFWGVGGEKAEAAFVKGFRELIRIRNVLGGFSDYDIQDLSMDDQMYQDYIDAEKSLMIQMVSKNHELDLEALTALISKYEYTGTQPLRDDIAGLFTRKLGILERQKKIEETQRIITLFIEMFIFDEDGGRIN